MKKLLLAASLVLTCSFAASAQFGKLKVDKGIGAAVKGVQALTVTDAEMAAYAQEYIDWMDAHNPVCDDSKPGMKVYADRLANIIKGYEVENGIKLDIKAYYVIDQNAFACPNGSIRVFAGLMDLMTDDEIFGIVGHEIGHIVNTDSKNGFKKALLTSALKDAVASAGGAATELTDSQLGDLGEALVKAQFSQKQEYAADDYGYEFLKKSGKDPKAMASALRIIQGLQDGDQGKVNQLFSTHPESGKRAERLEKRK